MNPSILKPNFENLDVYQYNSKRVTDVDFLRFGTQAV